MIQRRDLCADFFFPGNSKKKKKKSHSTSSWHSSLRFKLRLRPAISFIIYFPPLFSCYFFFPNASSRAHFQPLFLYGLSLTTEFLCDPFHRAHHGNLVRPGKNAPRRTQGHILCKKRKKKWGESVSIWIPFFPQQLLTGMAEHKTGSVWLKPLLFIDWRTRMTEWPTHLH